MTIADRIGVGVFAAVSAVTASLGIWQLQRRQDKITQIAARRAELSSTNSEPASGLDSTPPMFSRTQIADGVRYSGAEQFLVGPRAGPISITGRGKGTGLSAGGLGYYVISKAISIFIIRLVMLAHLAPFTLPEGRTLLVNRGWCRRSQAQAALDSAQVDQVAGSAAIVRPSEYTSADVTPRLDSNIFVRMDAEHMAMRTDPSQPPTNFIVDLLDDGAVRASSPVLRRRTVDDFLRFPVSPETHASYAFTWFALSAASAIIGGLRYRQKPRNKLLAAFQ